MTKKKLFLSFPPSEIGKPIVYKLVKDHNLLVTIFRAKVTPEETGYLVLDVTGTEADIAAGIESIKTFNVEVNETNNGLRRDESRCVHCGNCITHCPTQALSIKDTSTRRVHFDEEQCIECLSCLENCPFGAVKSIF